MAKVKANNKAKAKGLIIRKNKTPAKTSKTKKMPNFQFLVFIDFIIKVFYLFSNIWTHGII